MNIQSRSIWTLLGLLSIIATGCRSGMVGQSDGYAMREQRQSLFGNSAPEQMPLPNGMTQARDLERRGQTDAALYGYARIAENNPNFPSVWHRMAVCYDKLGQQNYAGACYERALSLDSNNAELWCDYGYGKFLQGDTTSADRAFRQALELNPGLRRAHNNLGLAMAQAGNTSAALEQFRLAGCDPQQASMNLDLAASISIPMHEMMPPVVSPGSETAVAEAGPSSPSAAQRISMLAGHAQAPMATSEMIESGEPMNGSLAVQHPVAVESFDAIEETAVDPNDSDPSMPIAVHSHATDTAKVPEMVDAVPMSIPSHETPAYEREGAMQTEPAVAQEMLAPPIVEDGSLKPMFAEKIEQLNAYATDPSIGKTELPAPEVVSVGESMNPTASPKQFSETTEKSFRNATDDTDRGVYTLITDLQRVRNATDESTGEKSNVVRRIGDIDE